MLADSVSCVNGSVVEPAVAFVIGLEPADKVLPSWLIARRRATPHAHARESSRRSLLRWSAPGPGHLWYWCTGRLASTPHSIRWWASAADDHGKSRAIMCGFALQFNNRARYLTPVTGGPRPWLAVC